MGQHGPIPKAPEQRRRRNKPAVPIDRTQGAQGAQPPAAEESWHPIARAWYESLAASGQSFWYEPSDWATALMVAENISRDLKPRPIGVHPETGEPVLAKVAMSGASLSAYLRAMTNLLVTIGDRRRAAVELERETAVSEGSDEVVVDLDAARRRLAG